MLDEVWDTTGGIFFWGNRLETIYDGPAGLVELCAEQLELTQRALVLAWVDRPSPGGTLERISPCGEL